MNVIVKIAAQTHDMIVCRALRGFDFSKSHVRPDGVEIELRQSTAETLAAIHPDPDLAIRTLMLARRRAAH